MNAHGKAGLLFAAIAIGMPVCGVWPQEASLPASPAKRISFKRPELPRFSVDTHLPKQSGQIIEAPADGNFQKAIHAARPGDTIVLQAGATYTGAFELPKKEVLPILVRVRLAILWSAAA